MEQIFSSSLLLEVSSSSPSVTEHLTFSFPPGLVEGSARASVAVAGTSTPPPPPLTPPTADNLLIVPKATSWARPSAGWRTWCGCLAAAASRT